MTAKEEAKNLCLEFQRLLFINLSDKEEDADYIHEDSKKCALLAVNRIMSSMEEVMPHPPFQKFWLEVKSEIEKL